MVGYFYFKREEKTKVSTLISRKEKVQENKDVQERQVKESIKKIAVDLQQRMKQHQRKRSKLQLEKIKSYKNSSYDWKTKVDQITIALHKREKNKFQKSQRMSRQIEEFWLKKESLKNSPRPSSDSKISNSNMMHSRTNSNSHRRSAYLSPRNKKLSAQMQVKDSRRHVKSNTKSDNTSKHHLIKVPHKKSQKYDSHILKYQQIKREKEQQYFQKAMKKIDIIMKRRIQTKQALIQHSRKHQQNKQLRNHLYFHQQKNQPKRNLSLRQQSQTHGSHRRSSVLMPYYNSELQQRRKELQQQNYRLRTEMLGKQKLKERRGKFHRMIRQAVKLCRVETLKGHP